MQASEVIVALKDAFAILGHPDLRRDFAAHDIWDVVAGIARLSRRRAASPAPYVRCGKAGMTLIAWLADVADTLGTTGAPIVTIGHPVVGSAADWIQATLDIGETTAAAPAAPAPTPRQTASASPWAALGA